MKIVKTRLSNTLISMPCIKINFTFSGEFELPLKVNDKGMAIRDVKTVGTKNITITQSSDLKQLLKDEIELLMNKVRNRKKKLYIYMYQNFQIDSFELENSGWRLVWCLSLQVAINRCDPLSTVGHAYIPLPPALENNPGLLNIINTDRRCFIYCIMASLYPTTTRPQDSNSYPIGNVHSLFNLKNIEFPVALKQVPLFEKQNPDISITVFKLDYKDRTKLVGPVYHTSEVKRNHINLLLLSSTNGKASHYVLIKDLSKVVDNSKFSDHHAKFVCNRCLNYFYSKEKLNLHEERCSTTRACRTTVPERGTPGAIVKFNNFKALLRTGFVCYSDFECLTEKFEQRDTDERATRKYQKHVPYSVAYQLVCSFDSALSVFESYRGPDAPTWFINQVRAIAARIRPYYNSENHKPMTPLTPEQKDAYYKSVSCPVCFTSYSDDNPRVHHHDHLSGEFIAPVCNNCNLQIKLSPILPILMHNLSGYDLHLFIDCLNYDDQPIRIIPNTTENYIAVSKMLENGVELRFLDSFRFMAASLDSLAQNLTPEEFKLTRKAFPNEDLFDLAHRKGVLPYDYINSWEVLEETCLPPIDAFFRKLKGERISQAEYEHAKLVWSSFNVSTLGQYSDLYMKIDVLLLSDVFESFRDLCMKNYGLDATAFFSAPGLAFSAALKVTGVRLELLYDIDQVLFCESAVKGGITCVNLRFCQANNEFMSTFDSSKPVTYLNYLDANNLYGWASIQPLPTGDFRWYDEDEIRVLELKLKSSTISSPYSADCQDEDSVFSSKSCFLEVDLEYPHTLHDAHSDLPFCPESKIPPNGREKKLLTTLEPKRNYVLHLEMLLLALNHGLQLIKVHRVLEFSQRPWLKHFIMLNTKLRTQATNNFEKNFFKLLNNANFGKTIENVRRYRNIKLVTRWEQAKKLISRAEFKSSTIFRENLIAIESWPTEIRFTKPLYVGACILELSKTLMYKFHFEYIKSPRVSNFFSADLAYLDTDSFIYKFTAKCPGTSIYDIIRRDCTEHFDTSDYPVDNPYNIPLMNKKVIGKFKDEMCGQILSHFIALRPKLYAYKLDGKEEVKKAKGIGGSAVRELSFNDYYQTLFENKQKYVSFNTIRSYNHVVYSEEITKLGLDSGDEKRYICSDNIHTLPWGYYKLPQKMT